ncbi:MAG: hypothetical protein LBL56_05185 [Treponema sp.]|jgi:hypothetical protein|nr:hypothetical protein [Treponema sp.]
MNIKPVMTKDPDGDLSVRGRIFWPYERVEEIFSRMEAARDTPRETVELMIFWRRMKRMYDKYSEELNQNIDEEDAMRLCALGEAVEDAEFMAAITEGREA